MSKSMEIKGINNTIKVFNNKVEETALKQVQDLANSEAFKGSKIRIMSDVHSGKGCVIGTTMTITDRIVPNLVGVDIGCGVLATKLNIKKEDIDFELLDENIRNYIPSGFNVHNGNYSRYDGKPYLELFIHFRENAINGLRCREQVDLKRAVNSLGTLGGGNHFISLEENEKGEVYLCIHSGSRNLGKQVAEHYQKMAISKLDNPNPTQLEKDLAYLTGQDMKDYLHDMKIVQNYASINRQEMSLVILNSMGWLLMGFFESVHNYIDLDKMILRKGAISSQKGEKLIIPLNMKDGSLICVGKGKEDWNFSAPHGSGRVLSRAKAKKQVQFKDYEEIMKDVWTSCVNENTLDESPFAYKKAEEIISFIDGETVDIKEKIRTIYSFKAN